MAAPAHAPVPETSDADVPEISDADAPETSDAEVLPKSNYADAFSQENTFCDDDGTYFDETEEWGNLIDEDN